MQYSKITWCSTLLIAGSVFAAPATQPATTQPADASLEAPVVQPAEDQTILILPFVESSGASHSWLGKAIQQDLLADLSRATRARVAAPATRPPATDAADALRAGRDANVSLVVYGQYQIVGNQARITGQILDVKTEKPGGTFAATGSATNLFPLEDSISGQLLRALPPGWLSVSLPPAYQSAQGNAEPYSVPVIPPQQATAPLPQYYSFTYPDYVAPESPYSYYYGDYPYYGYAVPYYGPDIWFFGGWDFYHHHHWRHDFDDHGFDHNFAPRGFGHTPSARPGSGGGSHTGGSGGSHSGGGGSHSGSGGSHTR